MIMSYSCLVRENYTVIMSHGAMTEKILLPGDVQTYGMN